MSVEGRVALVTGAATRIGAALANGLAVAGAHVVGADFERAICDVTDKEAVQGCVAHIEKHHGPVDILVNNAAIASLLKPTRSWRSPRTSGRT